MLIGDHDRPLYFKDKFPNNRLTEFGIYRKLAEGDLDKPMIHCGKDFLDKVSWSDYWYEVCTDPNRRTYLCDLMGSIRCFTPLRGVRTWKVRDKRERLSRQPAHALSTT